MGRKKARVLADLLPGNKLHPDWIVGGSNRNNFCFILLVFILSLIFSSHSFTFLLLAASVIDDFDTFPVHPCGVIPLGHVDIISACLPQQRARALPIFVCDDVTHASTRLKCWRSLNAEMCKTVLLRLYNFELFVKLEHRWRRSHGRKQSQYHAPQRSEHCVGCLPAGTRCRIPLFFSQAHTAYHSAHSNVNIHQSALICHPLSVFLVLLSPCSL